MTFTIHGTKKLLDRIKPAALITASESSFILGNWYATAIFWKPHLALFVCERTLLPVLMPLAPAAELAPRFPIYLFDLLSSLGTPIKFIDHELAHMNQVQYAKTANRSVVGVMNQFVFMAEVYREDYEAHNLLALSVKLAGVPCGPLYKGEITPERELKRRVAQLGFAVAANDPNVLGSPDF
jgi:hypothetical protein